MEEASSLAQISSVWRQLLLPHKAPLSNLFASRQASHPTDENSLHSCWSCPSSVNSKVAPPPPLASVGHPHGPWEEWVPAQRWLLQSGLWYPDSIFSHVPWSLSLGPSPTQWSLHGPTRPHSEKTQTHPSRLDSGAITSTWKPALIITPAPCPPTSGLAGFLVFYVLRCCLLSC